MIPGSKDFQTMHRRWVDPAWSLSEDIGRLKIAENSPSSSTNSSSSPHTPDQMSTTAEAGKDHQQPWYNPQDYAPPPPPPPRPINYRRNFTPSPLAYTNGHHHHHHHHHSLGNTQQLYDIMLPDTRQSLFRATHHHSASDPSALRDATALALLSNNIQSPFFQPGMPTMHAPPPPPPPPPIYPPQYYSQDLAVQQLMAARLQAQYTGPYPLSPPTPMENIMTPQSNSNAGPSANNRKLGLYKTELCRSWEEKGSCRYGTKCQFAHGEEELRRVARHPKYKTEICKTFWVSGSCPYGKRCCFIHTELSSVQTPPASGSDNGTPPQPSTTPNNSNNDNRERSNSDPDGSSSSSISLLSRISQRSIDTNTNATVTPINPTPTTAFPLTGRPPTGSLRVDTTNVDPSLKQNKSAYPTFASNGILLPSNSTSGEISATTVTGPGLMGRRSLKDLNVPVTAGPDLGRHAGLARMEIVGFPAHQRKGSTSSNPRHSLSGGSDIDLSFSPSPPLIAPGGSTSGHAYSLSETTLSTNSSSLSSSSSSTSNSNTASSTSTTPASASATSTTPTTNTHSPVQPIPTRVNGHGHVRAGSAGTLNWSSFSRSHLSSSSSSSSVGGAGLPWSSGDLAAVVGGPASTSTSRLNEKAWA